MEAAIMMNQLKSIVEQIRTFDIGEVVSKVRNFDIHNYSLHDIPFSGITLLIVITGIFVIILRANLSDNSPVTSNVNAALGSVSAAKKDSRAPPIPPPTEIVSLRIYPIKSCRGIELQGTRLRKTGLTLDRNWMFIDKKDRKFLTIRSDATMTLINTAIIDEKGEQMLEVRIQGTDTRVTVPAFPSKEWLESNTKLSTVEIWEQNTDAYEYGPEVNTPFCSFFKKDVALVYKGPTHRNVAVNGSPDLYGKNQNHHFADVMSLQVASAASIKDLNRRLTLKVDAELTIERFRPNIIVRGRDDKPWEEDTWKRIRISTALPEEEMLYKIDLDVVARCARCQVPNVDPTTAEKHAKQPWDELMKFRRVDQGGVAKWKPCFGMLCIPKNEGMVQIGAKVEVLETTDKHLYNTAKFSDL